MYGFSRYYGPNAVPKFEAWISLSSCQSTPLEHQIRVLENAPRKEIGKLVHLKSQKNYLKDIKNVPVTRRKNATSTLV